MGNHPTTISQVMHPDTGEVLAFEIVANDGSVYFVATDSFWKGMRVGPFPNEAHGPLERIEIARLPAQKGEG